MKFFAFLSFAALLMLATPVTMIAKAAGGAADSVHVLDNMKFTVKTVKGGEINFKEFLGKGPLLVSFWALWCEPCKQEMKAFKTLSERFKAEGVNMVAINTDEVRSMSKVRAYVSTQGLEFPVLLDANGDIARDMFSMETLPYSLILMPDGSVYKKHIGFTAGDEKETEKDILELIEKLKKKG